MRGFARLAFFLVLEPINDPVCYFGSLWKYLFIFRRPHLGNEWKGQSASTLVRNDQNSGASAFSNPLLECQLRRLNKIPSCTNINTNELENSCAHTYSKLYYIKLEKNSSSLESGFLSNTFTFPLKIFLSFLLHKSANFKLLLMWKRKGNHTAHWRHHYIQKTLKRQAKDIWRTF